MRRAFTLIELMVVIAIIAILTSLVVGIGRYVYDEAARRETEIIQETVMTAVEAYHRVTGNYPDDAAIVTEAQYSMSGLVLRMQGGDPVSPHPLAPFIKNACGPIILALPRDAYTGATINDGFGNAMEYRATGGLGGRPSLISGGPDQRLDTAQDNIRSDR